MDKIRIGKDITLRWKLTAEDGTPLDLTGRDLTMELRNVYCLPIPLRCSVSGNVVSATFHGIEQATLGDYTLTLWENKGRVGQNVADIVNAFALVANSDLEKIISSNPNLQIIVEHLGDGVIPEPIAKDSLRLDNGKRLLLANGRYLRIITHEDIPHDAQDKLLLSNGKHVELTNGKYIKVK